jgi:peptidyl-prolyl cis-trans isomerase D
MIMDWLRKHRNTIFLITIGGFLAGAFMGFGSYFFGRKSVGDAVAEVNGTKIPYMDYSTLLNRVLDEARKTQSEFSPEFLNQKKQETMQDLIQEEVFWQQAQKYGITVSDSELAADIQHYPAFQKDGKFDQSLYFMTLTQALRTTPRKFEESRRRQIAIYKLRYLIASSVTISYPDLQLRYSMTNKGDMKNFEKDRAAFLEKLKQEETSMVFQDWFKQLNTSTKVQIHLNEIEGTASQS